MKDSKQYIKTELDRTESMRKHLFEKGFLITDENTDRPIDEYPFYNNWTVQEIEAYKLYLYSGVKLTVSKKGAGTYILIGHAYNPFTMQSEEQAILDEIAELKTKEERIDKINELTGVFFLARIDGKSIDFMLDASGMQYACYGEVKGSQYIASHMRLPADLCDLNTSIYVEQLTGYRWYKYMLGNYLPGDLTCCDELKRVLPNTIVHYREGEDGLTKGYTIERFYPNKLIDMADTEEKYNEVIEQAATILKNTMAIIPEKWNRPAISLTGGIDSNTTFAAANGNYDKYETFSYISMDRESVDAEAARRISDRFGLKHTDYIVPTDNAECDNFELYLAIFRHNDGDIGRAGESDTRKKITLINSDVCDVEVKSWISETIRAYAYKYYGRKKFPKRLRPRNYTSLYKIFLGRRDLAVETDRYFEEYIEKTGLQRMLHNYDETDFFVWEMEHGGKCGLNIGVMKSCFDITIPYNNRKLLDILLRVPLEYRISDKHHMDLKKLMNKDLYDMNIRVVNLNETEKRKKAINLYYMINTRLPL